MLPESLNILNQELIKQDYNGEQDLQLVSSKKNYFSHEYITPGFKQNLCLSRPPETKLLKCHTPITQTTHEHTRPFIASLHTTPPVVPSTDVALLSVCYINRD